MNIQEFTELAGCKIIPCSKDWGGKFGYISADSPNCTFTGYKTEKTAMRAFIVDRFGETAGKAVLKLLNEQEI